MNDPERANPYFNFGKEQIESQIRRGTAALRFEDSSLESAFRSYHLTESRRGLMLLGLTGILLYGATGLVDYLSAGPLAGDFLMLRLAMSVPVLFAALLVVLRARSYQRVQWAAFISLTAAGWVTVAMLTRLPPDQQQYYLIGLTILVFVPYGFFRLSARFALVTGLTMTLGYALAMPVFGQTPRADWLQGLYFLVVANIVGSSACYFMEYYQRRDFLTRALLYLQRQELEQSNRHLLELATTDPLTGLANRRHFSDFLKLAWRNARRSKQTLTIIMLDIDWFKQLNDRYGHQQGDQYLTLFARIASAYACRPMDTIARYGGEEFALVLGNTSKAEGREIAENIRQAIKEQNLPNPEAPEGVMTISAGVASAVPGKRQKAFDLLKRADEALYTAKRLGRDRVVVDEQMPAGWGGEPPYSKIDISSAS